MQSLSKIPALQDEFTREWHSRQDLPADRNGLERLVIEQHLSNFRLWHEEDQARTPNAASEKIAQVKRNIDQLNQQRNDLIEEIDRSLLESLKHIDSGSAELHSETPGMMIDRLSILSLKLYHTGEEAKRRDASQEHRARNLERLKILEEQRSDLADNLRRLWDDLHAGRRRFKLYRQLKMYNDPALNPEIYGRKA
jgi:transposase